MRVLDLFSGLGGVSLGLRMAGGFETVQFCEIDPYCQKVLAKNFPGVPIHDDIKTFQPQRGDAAVVTLGFPCQDISNAGLRAGITGQRSGLWAEGLRCIRTIRPAWVIVENVAALLGRGLGRVLGDLAEIGFDAEWYCLRADQFGAPHRRDRIWVIAYPQRDEQPRPEPCCGTLGRVGRFEQSLAWDGGWEAALTRFRGMADGLPRSVERTDALRNAVVPQVVAEIGRAILQAHNDKRPDGSIPNGPLAYTS